MEVGKFYESPEGWVILCTNAEYANTFSGVVVKAPDGDVGEYDESWSTHSEWKEVNVNIEIL